MTDTLFPDMTAALADLHSRRLLAEAADHRLASLAARRRRQLRLRPQWAAARREAAPQPA